MAGLLRLRFDLLALALILTLILTLKVAALLQPPGGLHPDHVGPHTARLSAAAPPPPPPLLQRDPMSYR